MFQSILIVLDEKGENRSALERAIKLRGDMQKLSSKKQGADTKLHLLWVDFHSSIADVSQHSSAHGEQAKQQYLQQSSLPLHNMSAYLEQLEIPHQCHQVWEKRRYEAIVKKAHELNCDLVIKECSYQPSLKYLISKPLDWSLLRTCPQPLWLTHSRNSTFGGSIAAAVDPNPEDTVAQTLNRQLIETASKLSEINKKNLSILHSHCTATQEVILATGESMFDYRTFSEQARENRERLFNQLLSEFSQLTFESHLLEGEPDWAIPAYLKEHQTSLLVMGTSNKTGLKRALMGNTAESILAAIECDILALKPPGFTSPVL